MAVLSLKRHIPKESSVPTTTKPLEATPSIDLSEVTGNLKDLAGALGDNIDPSFFKNLSKVFDPHYSIPGSVLLLAVYAILGGNLQLGNQKNATLNLPPTPTKNILQIENVNEFASNGIEVSSGVNAYRAKERIIFNINGNETITLNQVNGVIKPQSLYYVGDGKITINFQLPDGKLVSHQIIVKDSQIISSKGPISINEFPILLPPMPDIQSLIMTFESNNAGFATLDPLIEG